MDALKNLFDLCGKTVIITGATGLLGSEYSNALAKCGANVVIVDLDPKSCQKMATCITRNASGKALGIACDITKRTDIENLVKKTVEKFSRIDILVNNAQYKSKGFFAPFEEFSLEDWEKVIAVNLTGMFLCCQIVGKQMLKQEKGNIINIASTYGVVAPDQRIYVNTSLGCPAVYSASKGGVIALTRYLAAYWADKNIRVNSISPHGVFNNHEPQFVKNFSDKSPMGRMSQKKEVVGALIYLASDASSYVTGHNLMVDGGWTVW